MSPPSNFSSRDVLWALSNRDILRLKHWSLCAAEGTSPLNTLDRWIFAYLPETNFPLWDGGGPPPEILFFKGNFYFFKQKSSRRQARENFWDPRCDSLLPESIPDCKSVEIAQNFPPPAGVIFWNIPKSDKKFRLRRGHNPRSLRNIAPAAPFFDVTLWNRAHAAPPFDVTL